MESEGAEFQRDWTGATKLPPVGTLACKFRLKEQPGIFCVLSPYPFVLRVKLIMEKTETSNMSLLPHKALHSDPFSLKPDCFKMKAI